MNRVAILSRLRRLNNRIAVEVAGSVVLVAIRDVRVCKSVVCKPASTAESGI